MITDLLPWKKKKNTDIEVKRMDKEDDNPFSLFHRKINKLFDDFFSMKHEFAFTEPGRKWPLAGLNPDFDVSETDHHFEITAELPGLSKEDIDVSLDDNLLCIKGEKKEEKEEKKRDYHISERRYGSFCRYLSLPGGLDMDKLKAEFKKGVLKISLPKTEEAIRSKRHIPIQAS